MKNIAMPTYIKLIKRGKLYQLVIHQRKKMKKVIISLCIITTIYFLIEFFGIISFFSPQMFFIGTVNFILLIWGIIKIISSIVNAFKKKNIKQSIIGIGLGVWAISIIFAGGIVHDYGLYVKLKLNEKNLIEACEHILKNSEPNKYLWNESFDLWTPLIGPTRKSIFHNNGVVYVDIEGSPNNAGGFAYNPQNKPIKNGKHIFGPWYDFYESYD